MFEYYVEDLELDKDEKGTRPIYLYYSWVPKRHAPHRSFFNASSTFLIQLNSTPFTLMHPALLNSTSVCSLIKYRVLWKIEFLILLPYEMTCNSPYYSSSLSIWTQEYIDWSFSLQVACYFNWENQLLVILFYSFMSYYVKLAFIVIISYRFTWWYWQNVWRLYGEN